MRNKARNLSVDYDAFQIVSKGLLLQNISKTINPSSRKCLKKLDEIHLILIHIDLFKGIYTSNLQSYTT